MKHKCNSESWNTCQTPYAYLHLHTPVPGSHSFAKEKGESSPLPQTTPRESSGPISPGAFSPSCPSPWPTEDTAHVDLAPQVETQPSASVWSCRLAAIVSAKRKNSGTMSSSTKDKNGFNRKFNVAPHMGYMSTVIQQATSFFIFFEQSPPCDAEDMCNHHNVSRNLCLIWVGVVAGIGDLKPPQVCGRWLCVSYDKQPGSASSADFLFSLIR